MKILTCPLNGPRPVSEFFCWGEVRPMPDPAACDDATWADYVFNRNGAPGVKREWWCHTPSNTWFIAERDTEKDVVVRTYFYEGEA
ncbi:sarcosine oxidase subunit delta [Zoogloea sp. 1C4]|uniref:sarcosine oxidase subunit delta n=1 Tax=Zoogloea sp. 1C4 TaxID=2570190 RepID=UPI001291DC68|nr:sarcosine oxidase subunit delta [Zoogloea sp. 1C4]